MRRRQMVGVVGASGGVGASVLAAAVASRADHAGWSVALVDGCRLGGGLDVTVGVEQEPGVRWRDLAALSGSADGFALLERMPEAEGVALLSHDRGEPLDLDAAVVTSVVAALADAVELVVVDLPWPMLDDALVSVVRRLERLVVVAGTQMRQLAAMTVTVRAVRAMGVSGDLRLAGCFRGARLLPQVTELVEAEMALPILATIGHDRSLVADQVHGVPPGSRGAGPLTAAADEVLAWAVDEARAGAA